MEKVKTGGLCHIAIDVNDLDRSAEFYTGMFDLEIVGRSNRIVHMKTRGADDSFFLFKADGRIDPQRCGMTHMHFGFRIDDGNFEKAIEYLREKGLAASQKKAGRIAAEGMAYAAVIDGVGVAVEVNAETDFVAKNDKFVNFVKGIAEGLGVAEEVVSPTFTLQRTYAGARTLHHFDLYRIEEEEELLHIGFYETLGEGVCVVEWAERAEALPPCIRVALSGTGADRRVIEIEDIRP
jgi:tRNA threonylcarbamoyl adenosine modification protein YjeE